MRIFIIIFCLFLSVNALAQTADTATKHLPEIVKFQDTTLHPEKMLIVIDDAIYKDSLNTIDPNSIASISILKYKDATAIYGPPASNGVLLITTKSALAKRDSAKTNIVIHDAPPSHKNKVLFVIDGKQTYTYATDNENVPSPDIIESVNILKPDAAKLRYGKLGENGAVIIKTKNETILSFQKRLSGLSKKYKEYLGTHNGNDDDVYYVVNGRVFNKQPVELNNKLLKIKDNQIKSIDFIEKWSKPLNSEHSLLVIVTK